MVRKAQYRFEPCQVPSAIALLQTFVQIDPYRAQLGQGTTGLRNHPAITKVGFEGRVSARPIPFWCGEERPSVTMMGSDQPKNEFRIVCRGKPLMCFHKA